MSLSFNLAWRLYKHGGDAKRISRPAVRIATFGVALGVAVMIVSVAIVIGFKREIQEKAIGMGGHIQVFSDRLTEDYNTPPITMTDSMLAHFYDIEGLTNAQRYCLKPGMIKTNDAFEGILLRGYGEEFDASFLKDILVEGEFEGFQDSVSSNRIYISQMMSRKLSLHVGDKVYCYFFDKNVRTRRPEVAGIYSTNIQEFDANTIFTDICTTRKLCGFTEEECSGVELNIADFDRLDEMDYAVSSLVAEIRAENECPYTSKTVRQLYAPLFSWLTLLDTNVWVILALMTAVAAFTMISGLLIIILEQTQFIGTMKAFGATNGLLRRLFLYLSTFIIGKGVLLGNIAGIGLILLQQQTHFIKMNAEYYYVENVPVDMNWAYILYINASTIVISVLVLVIPSYLVSKIHPARSIRFE